MKATTLTLRKPRSELAGSWLDRLARALDLDPRGARGIEDSLTEAVRSLDRPGS